MAGKLAVSLLLLIFYFTQLFAKSERKNEANLFFDEYWEWRLLNNPQLATTIGLTQYDDRVNEMSLSSYRRREDQVGKFLNRLHEIKKRTNDSDSLMNIDLLQEDLSQYLKSSLKFKPYLFPLNNMEGPHYYHMSLISTMRKTTFEDMRNILTRMRLFAQQIEETIALLREGIRLGRTMNRRSFQRLITVYEKFATKDYSKNPFYTSFKAKPLLISNSSWNDILEEAKNVIENYTQPSYRRLIEFLKNEYLPKSRRYIGVSSLPDGLEYYQACLNFHTTTNLSAHEIHEIGLKEVRRITKRMETIKRQVKFNGTLGEFRNYLRTSQKFGFQDENELLKYYKSLQTNISNILPTYFGKLPSTPLQIKAIPTYLAKNAAFAYYEPSGDGTQPGVFRINTYKPNKKRIYVAKAVFLHEALPGHHLQISLKLQHGSPVSFRRFAGSDALYYEVPASFASNNAYIEGWALYCEYLGEEMGLYKNPYEIFGRLSLEMLRAARLVVDTGMHVFKWPRKRAVKFMAQNTAEDMDSIYSEVDRYISWPGQACSYKIGELKIKKLRRKAEKRLGSNFDLREFHDYIISLGNIPLTVLERQIDLLIKKKLKNHHSSNN